MYGIKIDELWDWLKEGDENRDIMTCGTSGNGDDTKQNRVGLAMSHAYTVLGVVEVNDRTYNKKERLVKLRNPWGKETYKGPWCDSCHEWTEETEKQAGLQKSDDGIFFIPIRIYQREVAYSLRNINPDNITRKSHLVLDDVSNKTGWTPWCGRRCTQHTYKFKSTKDQKVIIRAQTWEGRSNPDKCVDQAHQRSAAERRQGHVMYINGG